jgi:hypothetical protein
MAVRSRIIALAPSHSADWVQHISTSGDALEIREQIVHSDGTSAHHAVTARFDGIPCPVTGSPNVDAITYTRPEPARIVAVAMKGGRTIFEEEVRVTSGTESKLTMIIRFAMPDGLSIERVAVFRCISPSISTAH